MSSLLTDLRHALRRLGRAPGFALVAILTLALGIGANSTIFSVIYTAFLRPLPYADADRLVRVYETTQRGNRSTVSPANYIDFRDGAPAFEHLAAYYPNTATLTGEGLAEQVSGARVTGETFDVLAVRPLLGRAFSPAEATSGGPKAIMLGHALWQRRFGGDPALVGRTIRIDGESYQVVGIMPPGFAFPREAQLWLPLAFSAEEYATQRGAHYLATIGRLRTGATLEQARAQLAAIAARLAVADPKHDAGMGSQAITLRESTIGDARRPLLMLLGAVGFLLLVACANVANLLLARAAERTHEMSVRRALGADRGRLAASVMAEGLVLAVAGGLAGVLLAIWGLPFITRALAISYPSLTSARLDTPVLGGTLLVALATGIIFSAGPALAAARAEGLMAMLKGVGTAAGATRRSWHARGVLVAVETALAVVLLTGGGLMLRSFMRLQQVDLGFRPEGAWTAYVSLPEANYPPPRAAQFFGALLARVQALPGVTTAGAISLMPLSGDSYSFSVATLDGLQQPDESAPSLQTRVVGGDYLRAAGIRLVAGRALGAGDREGAPLAVMISESAARLLWPGGTALGHRVTLGTGLGLGKEHARAGGEVVGIVGDVRDQEPGSAPLPTIYLAHAQFPVGEMGLVVRAADPPAQQRPVAEAVAALDRDVPVASGRTLDIYAQDAVAGPRLFAALLLAFSLTALAIAAIGIYGVMALLVGQRTREIGLRIALGARAADVVGLVVRQGVAMAAAGGAVGIAGALALSRLMRGLLFEVPPSDPVTYLGSTLLLVLAAFLAAWLPARRAVRVDPMVALRGD